MKKLFIVMLMSLSSVAALAAEPITNGQQYIRVQGVEPQKNEVTEFFSFNCSHCYQFEHEFKIPQKISAKLDNKVKFIRYHVDFLPPFGEQLSQAWAVAVALGIEDKILMPMFNAINVDKKIKSPEDIKQVFLDAGVSSQDYDSAWNSLVVKTMVEQQRNKVEQLKVQSVPAMFANGVDMINPAGFKAKSLDDLISDYVDVVTFLIKQNQ